MTVSPEQSAHPDYRPWYREPWPWVLIAIPALTVIACGYTLWLAISNPDYLVLDNPEYNEVKSGLRAQSELQADTSKQVPDKPDGGR
jgi:hypothetical protein